MQRLGRLDAFAQHGLDAAVAGRDQHAGAEDVAHDKHGVVGQRLVDQPYRIAVVSVEQGLGLLVGLQGGLLIRGYGIAAHIAKRHDDLPDLTRAFSRAMANLPM
ncbi:hypothetical protein D3C72_1972150 [compost metagenome]